MPPRVLVVRSGDRSVLDGAPGLGIAIVERVSHRIEPVASSAAAQPADVVIFTSRTAVTQGLGGAGAAALRPVVAAARCIAVGPGTAAALRESGLEPEIVAGGSAEAVLAQLPEKLDGVRVLLPCGEDASSDLPEGLRGRGASVTRRVVYRKVARPHEPALAGEIMAGGFAAFSATSPAAARWLFGGLGVEGLERLRAIPAAVLGPSTRSFLTGQGVARVAVAPDARFSSLLRLLERLATAPAGQ